MNRLATINEEHSNESQDSENGKPNRKI